MLNRVLIAVLAVVGLCVPSAAQRYQTVGGQTVPSAVTMCPNGVTNSDGTQQVTACGAAGGGGSAVNLTQVGGSAIAIGQAPMAASLPVAIASDQTAIPVTITSGSSPVGSVTVSASTPEGAPADAAWSGSGSGAIIPILKYTAALIAGPIAAGAANIGGVELIDSGGTNKASISAGGAIKVDNSAVTQPVNLLPPTSGGWSFTRTQVPNNTTSVVLKGSAGQVGTIEAYSNPTATVPAYVKLYNLASNTCGTGTPVWQGMIPFNSTNGSGFIRPETVGMAFGTGITMCVTTGFADNDTTAPAASAYIVNVEWK